MIKTLALRVSLPQDQKWNPRTAFTVMHTVQLVKPKNSGPLQDVSLCKSTNHTRKCWPRERAPDPGVQAWTSAMQPWTWEVKSPE